MKMTKYKSYEQPSPLGEGFGFRITVQAGHGRPTGRLKSKSKPASTLYEPEIAERKTNQQPKGGGFTDPQRRL